MGSITDELNRLLKTSGGNIAEAIEEYSRTHDGVPSGDDIDLLTKSETLSLLSSEESGGE